MNVTLTDENRRKLVRIAKRILGVGQASAAEDVVHTTLVKLLLNGMPESVDCPLAWISKAVKNQAYDWLRGIRSGQRPLEDLGACEPRIDGEASILGAALRAAVEEELIEIAQEATKQAEVLARSLLHDLDDAEIARQLNIGKATVRVHRFRGLAKLARRLERRGFGSGESSTRNLSGAAKRVA
jgi:RNA polymerase sigma factor (sigma-70 family)